jgi:mono/diheme cytochrome c family protein
MSPGPPGAWPFLPEPKIEKNPFTASAELMAEAKAHFADHCAICHANNGNGNTEIGQNLYPKAPDMRLPQTQNLTDGELYYTIHNGIRLTGMPAWGTEEKDQDSWKPVLFIRHLPQLTWSRVKGSRERSAAARDGIMLLNVFSSANCEI